MKYKIIATVCCSLRRHIYNTTTCAPVPFATCTRTCTRHSRKGSRQLYLFRTLQPEPPCPPTQSQLTSAQLFTFLSSIQEPPKLSTGQRPPIVCPHRAYNTSLAGDLSCSRGRWAAGFALRVVICCMQAVSWLSVYFEPFGISRSVSRVATDVRSHPTRPRAVCGRYF